MVGQLVAGCWAWSLRAPVGGISTQQWLVKVNTHYTAPTSYCWRLSAVCWRFGWLIVSDSTVAAKCQKR